MALNQLLMTSPELENWGSGEDGFILSPPSSPSPAELTQVGSAMIGYQAPYMNQSAVIRKVKVTTSIFVCYFYFGWAMFWQMDKEKQLILGRCFKKIREGFQVSPQESILFCILPRQDELHWGNPLCIEMWRPGTLKAFISELHISHSAHMSRI